MEAQKSIPALEKKSRRDRERAAPSADFPTSENSLDLPRNPVYPDQGPSNLNSQVGNSIEGFVAKDSKDSGMTHQEDREDSGAGFQMPEARSSDNFINAHAQVPVEAGIQAQALDIQASVEAIQTLVTKIRANLDSAEQAELEEFIRQGAAILSAHYKTLTAVATEQVRSVKSELKDNPYRSLISALKLGMALSQVYFSHKEARSPSAKGEQA